MTEYNVNIPFGYPEFCCHATCGFRLNWVLCELVENEDHTNYESCKYLRETGRCLHP